MLALQERTNYTIKIVSWEHTKKETGLKTTLKTANTIRSICTLAALITSSIFSLSSHAIGLEGIRVHSSLGEPLLASMDVHLQAGETLTASCVKLKRESQKNDVPILHNAKLSLTSKSNGARVVFTTRQAMTEPAVRVSLSVGCDTPINREQVLVFSPKVKAGSGDTDKAVVAQVRADEKRSVSSTDNSIVSENIVGAEPAASAKASKKGKKRRAAKKRAKTSATHNSNAVKAGTLKDAPSVQPSVQPSSTPATVPAK